MEGGLSPDGGSSSRCVCLCHLLYESLYGIPDLFTSKDRKLCYNTCLATLKDWVQLNEEKYNRPASLTCVYQENVVQNTEKG